MKLAKILSLLVIGLLLCGLSACGGGKKPLAASVAADEPREGRDRELFEEALKEMKKKRYEQGRLLINTLITTYDNSPLLSMAKLTIADSYYREGGSSNLVQAEAEYKDWLQFFPNHELAPEVLLKLAEIHLRQVEGFDQDNTHALLAEKQLLEAQRRFPQTKENPRVQEYTYVVQELLARHDLVVAKFYFERRDAWKATESRCLDIINKYPNFSQTDTALWYLARAREESEDTEDAAKYYARIVREFPNSKYRDAAAEKLEKFGKPVPDPDPNAPERIVEERSMMGRMMENLFGPNLKVTKEGILLKEGDEIDEATYQLINETVRNGSASPQSISSKVGAKPSDSAVDSTASNGTSANPANVPKVKDKKNKKSKKDSEKSKAKPEADIKP
ncbi:MAG: outer membrane protein assembly factor BamD [Acidobacteriota bacterium]